MVPPRRANYSTQDLKAKQETIQKMTIYSHF